MTNQHLIALLILINQLLAAGPGVEKASEEKFSDLIEARSFEFVLASFLMMIAMTLKIIAVALKMVAIFLLFLAGSIVIDSVVLAHKVFAVVQPPHLAWLHEWVPQFLDPVLVYQVKNYEV